MSPYTLYLLRLKSQFLSQDINHWLERYTPFMIESDFLRFMRDSCDSVFTNCRDFLEPFFSSHLRFSEFQRAEGIKNQFYIFIM